MFFCKIFSTSIRESFGFIGRTDNTAYAETRTDVSKKVLKKLLAWNQIEIVLVFHDTCNRRHTMPFILFLRIQILFPLSC